MPALRCRHEALQHEGQSEAEHRHPGDAEIARSRDQHGIEQRDAGYIYIYIYIYIYPRLSPCFIGSPGTVAGPAGHQLAAFREQIATTVGLLDLVADRVRQRHLDHEIRV